MGSVRKSRLWAKICSELRVSAGLLAHSRINGLLISRNIYHSGSKKKGFQCSLGPLSRFLCMKHIYLVVITSRIWPLIQISGMDSLRSRGFEPKSALSYGWVLSLAHSRIKGFLILRNIYHSGNKKGSSVLRKEIKFFYLSRCFKKGFIGCITLEHFQGRLILNVSQDFKEFDRCIVKMSNGLSNLRSANSWSK